MDRTTGERLLGWKLLNTIMRQIRLVLGGAVSGAYCIPCICFDSLHVRVYMLDLSLLSSLIFCLLVEPSITEQVCAPKVLASALMACNTSMCCRSASRGLGVQNH